MFNVTLEQVKRVAFLSRIYFNNVELDKITHELNGVLHWIEKIQGVNTDNVDPLVSPNDGVLVFLDDIPEDNSLQEKVLRNAPKTKYGYFVVPKVIE